MKTHTTWAKVISGISKEIKMKQIRKNIFETNSSSTHAFNVCTEDEFSRWISEELLFDKWNDELVDSSDKDCSAKDRYLNTNEWYDYHWHLGHETFSQYFVIPSGDKMVAFGYFGHEGYTQPYDGKLTGDKNIFHKLLRCKYETD